MRLTLDLIRIVSVTSLFFLTSACGFYDISDFFPQKENKRKSVSHITRIPFTGNYQQGYEALVEKTKACFSSSNQFVKALQLQPGLPAQIDVFDRETSYGEPLPSHLKAKASLTPDDGGGVVTLETFSASGFYDHDKMVRRMVAWLENRNICH